MNARTFATRVAHGCARNPVALERLTNDRAAMAVTFRSDRSAVPKAGTKTVDPLAFPSCYGAMRIVARIGQTSLIDQILTHLRTHASREAHAGPRTALRLARSSYRRAHR